MPFPFSMHCDCCGGGGCRACPCASGTAPSALVFEFGDWGSHPLGYCSDCEGLNSAVEVPQVSDFTLGTALGDPHDYFAEHEPCFGEPAPGLGCKYEAEWEFDCVPAICLEPCTAGCGRDCQDDGDCNAGACGEYYDCGATDPTCNLYGGACVVECAQEFVCVFDEEFDPEHEHGVCTPLGTCSSSVVAESCNPLRLRLRAVMYVDDELRGVLSLQVVLFCRTAAGEETAVILVGVHRFESGSFDCGELDVEVPLVPAPLYEQPVVPACGPATWVRIGSAV